MASPSPAPIELLRRIDQVSDRFESAWQAGAAPQLEVLLEEFSDHEQAVVLRELLALDIELTRRQGSLVSPTNYRSRFVRHAQVVEEILLKFGLSEPSFGADSSDDNLPDQTEQQKSFFPAASGSGKASPASSATKSATTQRYRTTRLHARGGLGLVYIAEDEELHRQVALKEIKDKYVSVPMHRQQFLFEAEVTGALEHPGVVPVHGLGTYPDGRPYYAMRFIRGVSLKEAVQRYFQNQAVINSAESQPDATTSTILDVVMPADRGLAFRELLARFCDVCNTLEYAHSRGVLHRDLKPDNIMLGKYGETFVVDWGLATLIDAPLEQPFDESLLRTRLSGSGQSGSVVGTPGYMSPEQASGAERLTSATDVYGLGATLYFLLTGQPPVSMSGQLTEVLERVRSGSFPAPNKVRADVPAALNAVCMKALALHPEERYASALELKRDLQRWLADEPVTAYRDPWPTRTRRWAKRHKTLVTTSAVSATLLLAVWGVWDSWETHRVQGHSMAAKSALRDAESSLQQHQFKTARKKLDTAKDRVQSEAALADLLPAVLATEAQYRLMVSTDAKDNLRRADELVRELKFTEATALFSRVRASLEGDDKFAELRQRAHNGEEMAQAHEQAEVRWQQFRRLAEKARFFGSYIGGGSSTESAARALKASEDALQVYKLAAESVPDDFRSRGRETSVRTLTSSATSERLDELRSLTFELLLIRAETQVLANQEESQRTATLESSLELLTQAERLLAPKTSQIVWTQRAAYLRQLGKLSESQAAAKVAETTTPQSALEFFLAGELSRRVDRDFAQAEANYLEALHRNPRDHWIHFALGACQLERVINTRDDDRNHQDGYLAAAIHALTSSRALAPDFPWPLVLRGSAYALMNDFVHAEQDFADAEAIVADERDSDLTFDPTLLRSAVKVNRAVTLRIRQAKQATDEAQRNDYYEQAVAELQAALQDNELVQARSNLGLALSGLKRHAEAREAWTAALNHSDAQEPRLRAKLLQDRGEGTLIENPKDLRLGALARQDFLEALRGLDRVQMSTANSQRSKQRAELRKQLCALYLLSKEPHLALAQVDAALREDDAPILHRLRGECLFALKQFDVAHSEYSRFVKQVSRVESRDKLVADAFQRYGMLSLQLQKGLEALSPLTAALDTELDGAIATKRGSLLLTEHMALALHDFDQAIEWYRARGEENWEAYAGRAFARAKLGQPKTAIDDIEKAIRLGLHQIDNEKPPIIPQQQKGFLLFNAACTYAVVLRHVRLNKQAEPDHEKSLQELTQRAIELLQLAQDRLEPKVLATALADDALDSIRETTEFKAIQKQLTGAIGK